MPGGRDVMRLWSMGGQHQPAERIEALSGLIARLSAPDLTLAESEALRARVHELLESGHSVPPPPAMASARGRSEGARLDVWSADTSIRAAG